MARSLSVKVPTASLIALVEQKIADLETAIAEYPKAVQDYKNAVAEYNKNLIALAIDALTNKADLIGEDHDSIIRVYLQSYRNSVEVQFDADALGFPKAPVSPENPNSKQHYGREYSTQLEILTKNLKVLKMTQQEEVNASTYSSVMDLL
jgi:uncharacterized coiled-coil protein SlyX